MNAEILLIKIKEFLESSDEFQNSKIYVLPCKGDPTILQKETSLMILELIPPNGMKPIFTVTVNIEGK